MLPSLAQVPNGTLAYVYGQATGFLTAAARAPWQMLQIAPDPPQIRPMSSADAPYTLCRWAPARASTPR